MLTNHELRIVTNDVNHSTTNVITWMIKNKYKMVINENVINHVKRNKRYNEYWMIYLMNIYDGLNSNKY